MENMYIYGIAFVSPLNSYQCSSMGKVDTMFQGTRKFPKELNLHIVYLELDTNRFNMTWLNHAYLLPSYPYDWGLVRGKKDFLLFLNVRRQKFFVFEITVPHTERSNFNKAEKNLPLPLVEGQGGVKAREVIRANQQMGRYWTCYYSECRADFWGGRRRVPYCPQRVYVYVFRHDQNSNSVNQNQTIWCSSLEERKTSNGMCHP